MPGFIFVIPRRYFFEKRKDMDLGELRPSIKSAIMYEEMTGKNFLSGEMSTEDMMEFMYCVYANTIARVSYPAFLDMLSNKKFSNAITLQWKHYERFMGQFKEKEKKEEETEDDDKKKQYSMKEIAQALIFKYGLDADYVLNKVELWELDYLISIGEGAYRDNAEEKRMWAFYQLMPHLDPKKSKNMTPAKMFPFPWEETVHTKEGRKKVLEKESKRMQKTIGMHLDI